MANTLSVTQKLIERILFKFEERNSFLAPDLSVRDYVEYFDHKKNGGEFTGNSVRVRLPNIFIPYQGWTIPAQGVQEAEATLTLQAPVGVGTSFQSDQAQQFLDIEGDSYLERVAEPAAKGIMAKMNTIVADAAVTEIYNFVGDASADITSPRPFYSAETMLTALSGVDRGGFIDEAFCAIHPYVKESFSDAMLAKFTPSINTELYHKGRMGMVNNIEVMPENAVHIQRSYTGAMGTPAVASDSTNGTTIDLSGLTIDITGIIKAGDLLSIAACKKVNPLTKNSMLYSAQFVVKPNPSTSDGSYDSSHTGTCTINVNPYDARTTITVDGDSQPNPFQTLDRQLTTGDLITFVGSHIANICWLKPMLTLCFPPLQKMNKGAESETHADPINKIWLRYSAQDFISNSTHTRRIDARPGILWRGDQALKIICKIPAGL